MNCLWICKVINRKPIALQSVEVTHLPFPLPPFHSAPHQNEPDWRQAPHGAGDQGFVAVSGECASRERDLYRGERVLVTVLRPPLCLLFVGERSTSCRQRHLVQHDASTDSGAGAEHHQYANGKLSLPPVGCMGWGARRMNEEGGAPGVVTHVILSVCLRDTQRESLR